MLKYIRKKRRKDDCFEVGKKMVRGKRYNDKNKVWE